MPEPRVYSFTKIEEGLIRPMVPIKISNPETRASIAYYALLDTGADRSFFPKFVADRTGHILKHKDVEDTTVNGINGVPITTWKHIFKIELLSPDCKNVVWKGKNHLIDCVDHDKTPPLLGYNDFLSNFRITFNYKTKKIIFEFPN